MHNLRLNRVGMDIFQGRKHQPRMELFVNNFLNVDF